MFDSVMLRGGEGAVVWGYYTAALCQSWTIRREGRSGAWALAAVVSRADAYKLTKADLKFTAPRKGGYFCFPVLAITLEGTRVAATLGPPEN